MGNVLNFPVKGKTGGLKNKTVDVDFSDIDPIATEKVFEVINFLSANQNELIQKFKPTAQKFLKNKDHFDGTAFRKSYEQAFRNLILSQIKDEIADHFAFTPEEIAILTDEDFIEIVTEGNIFDVNNYIREEK